MDDLDTSISQMSKESLLKWLKEKFNDDIASKFEEQGVVNGQLLIVLGTKGSTSQLEACGLKTVGDQLRFKQLVALEESSTCSSSSSSAFVRMHRKKPSRDALKDVGDLNKRILHAKKKAVRAATLKKWPGNEIPTFRKNKDSMKQLDELVEELLEECAFPPVGFDAQAIRQHILDILNERRRSVRKGHDYTKADKRTLKKKKIDAVSCEEEGSGGDTDILTGSSSSENNDPLLMAESSDTEQGLTLQSAKNIVCVMFNAIRFSDIAKGQMVSAAKQLKVKYSTTSSTKEDLAIALAEIFVEKKFVKLQTKDLGNVDRQSILIMLVLCLVKMQPGDSLFTYSFDDRDVFVSYYN